MGRRRWRFITIAAFLLFMTKDTQCQDENDFYYTPIERSFAQVQPPLYPNNRPATYYEQDAPFSRPGGPPTIASGSLYEENRVRFPAPNYNQNPSPFQLPTGRSQSGGQYYVNQPDYTPTRQRYRPALPHNYQIIHPASTKRPEIAQIHSVAYENDPSKPETFLGQVTINNPDIDYLQNSRFKNVQFEGNSLKNNGQGNHGISNIEDVDNDDQDIFEQHRVTTYNPNKMSGKQRIIRPNPGRFPHYEGDPNLNDKTIFEKTPAKLYDVASNNFNKPKTAAKSATAYHDSSTEYKAMLDLEPLLEDDIRDIPSFRELMKNTKGSYDVQVIKSNHSDESEKYDSNPSASSLDSDNMQKEEAPRDDDLVLTDRHPTIIKHSKESNETKKQSQELEEIDQDSGHEINNSHEGTEENEEYADYYDDDPTPAPHTTTPKQHATEDYEEYDASEERDHSNVKAQESESKHDSKESFDVVAIKPNNTMVEDDNFKEFVDSSVIDETEHSVENDTTETNIETVISSQEVSSIDTILRQEVVSVVTTKSVVNGTISVPDVTDSPISTKAILTTESPLATPSSSDSNSSIPMTTENWIVVASVQTSRSVSGARFLPFPTVEQEEKKQVLADEKDEDEDGSIDDVTDNPKEQSESSDSQQTTSMSTENINDKLDSIQSELSSAVLSGSLDNDNKNIEIITESTTTKQPTTTSTTTTITTTTTSTTTTTQAPKLFTLRSTEIPVSTERSAPDPLPVLIKKFTPRVSTTSSTTPKPKKKLVTVMDDLSGLLPAGYKPRMSYKDKRTSTTTSTSTTTTAAPIDLTLSDEKSEENANSTQGRSSGISSKNKVIIRDNKSPFVPKDFKNKELKQRDELFGKIPQDSFSKLLPPGYKPPTDSSETKGTKPSIFDKVEQIDISAFLPKGFNLTTTTTEKPRPKILPQADPVDLSALLPPGFKLNTSEIEAPELPIKNIKVADVSNLLPPGFTLSTTEEPVKTTPKTGGIKLVFPSRPGSKPIRKPTPPKIISESGPVPVTPEIKKGWPTRASTEFTGWPSPSTTPFSIEKLLEAQRNATATSPMPELSTEEATRRTTTSTTTPVPTAPTTPGICKRECDIAATIKIVSGVKWIPELLDHHTEEWQNLAQEIKDELNSVYSKSDILRKWYKGIRIDGFSQGSVLVDYIIELNDVKERVDTIELKKLFHKSLNEAGTGSYVETVTEESNEGFDPDVMLGDQPEEERMKKSNEKMTKTIDKSAGKLEIGKFVMDPAYTEFIVLPKREEITTLAPDEESFLPQWGIAVIVIAMASLLFVVIFGVTVLVNRQKSAKAKQPIPLSEDMLRELDKSHMGGFDDLHQLKEREIPYQPSGKRMSTAFIEQLAYQNPGDSWRSEWTPQLQKYMQQQHYTPDSGRGSQIYGAAGNPYGYGGGSQLYGQTGGSQIYGYSGEYPPHPRSHYSRRRSEYDSNF